MGPMGLVDLVKLMKPENLTIGNLFQMEVWTLIIRKFTVIPPPSIVLFERKLYDCLRHCLILEESYIFRFEMRSHLLLFFSNVSQFVFSSFFATMHELSRNCHTRTFGFQRSSMKYQNEKLSLFERCSTRFFLKKSQQNFNVFNKISDFFLINFTFGFFCVRKHIVFMLSAFLFGIIKQIHMQIIIFKYFFLHFLPQD